MYRPTAPTPEGNDRLREQSFTSWLSPDLHQATIEFQRNIGLLPVYIECNDKRKRRTIYCRWPAGRRVVAHSGRTEAQFLELDRRYKEKGIRVLSLHVHDGRLHSAVWIEEGIWTQGLEILGSYGLSNASDQE